MLIALAKFVSDVAERDCQIASRDLQTTETRTKLRFTGTSLHAEIVPQCCSANILSSFDRLDLVWRCTRLRSHESWGSSAERGSQCHAIALLSLAGKPFCAHGAHSGHAHTGLQANLDARGQNDQRPQRKCQILRHSLYGN
eukprot:6189289-Pleurochrysis_carterae.AAC.2